MLDKSRSSNPTERCVLTERQRHLLLQSVQGGAAGLDLLQDGLVPHDREGPHGGVDCAHAGVVLLQPGHALAVDVGLQSQQRKHLISTCPAQVDAKAGC